MGVFLFIIIVGSILIAMVVRENEKKKESREAVSEKTERKQLLKRIYKVVGVTYKNEDDEDIQSALKKIANGYRRERYLMSFNGMTSAELVKEYKDHYGPDSLGEFEGQYVYNKISLVEDPNNDYDENAIKVYIKNVRDEMIHVGYIAKKDNVELKQLLNEKELKRTTLEFTGGIYKDIDYDYNVNTDEITRGLIIELYFD